MPCTGVPRYTLNYTFHIKGKVWKHKYHTCQVNWLSSIWDYCISFISIIGCTCNYIFMEYQWIFHEQRSWNCGNYHGFESVNWRKWMRHVSLRKKNTDGFCNVFILKMQKPFKYRSQIDVKQLKHVWLLCIRQLKWSGSGVNAILSSPLYVTAVKNLFSCDGECGNDNNASHPSDVTRISWMFHADAARWSGD